MPISIVVGGQFGSEGKGKVSLEIARRAKEPTTVVRVGGPNSGHTAFDRAGNKWALRQMPAGCVDRNVDVVFPAGSYIDVDLLRDEIAALQYPLDKIAISPYARIITQEHKDWEVASGLIGEIGSTGSGVGAAVLAAVGRGSRNLNLRSPEASDNAVLQPHVSDTVSLLRTKLAAGHRIVVEGTQGFGLSLLDGGYWPNVTARPTTAAGALSEVGLSPLDVDDITLVIRSFPIRVGGNSGPLPGETDWSSIARSAGLSRDLREFTTVTNRLRRVATFDPEIVQRAINANRPTRLVLNHADYIGPEHELSLGSSRVRSFVDSVATKIDHHIDWLGFSPRGITKFAGHVA